MHVRRWLAHLSHGPWLFRVVCALSAGVLLNIAFREFWLREERSGHVREKIVSVVVNTREREDVRRYLREGIPVKVSFPNYSNSENFVDHSVSSNENYVRILTPTSISLEEEHKPSTEKTINVTYFRKTVDKLQQEGNGYKSSDHETNRVEDSQCPPGRVFTVESTATDLAGQLWQYASLWAVTRLYDDRLNLHARISPETAHVLNPIFAKLSVSSLADVPASCVNRRLRQLLGNVSALRYSHNLPYDAPVLLAAGAIRLRDISRLSRDELRTEFRFSKSVAEDAQRRLAPAKKKGNILVAVHMTPETGGMKVSPAYYRAAMQWMTRRHKDAVFALVGADKSLCKTLLARVNNIKDKVYCLPGDTTPAQELVTLASCDHCILGLNTLGTFAALLVEGDVTVPTANDTSIGEKLAEIMSNWYQITGPKHIT